MGLAEEDSRFDAAKYSRHSEQCVRLERCEHCGCRMWDTNEFDYDPYVDYVKTEITNKPFTDNDHVEEAEKIFERELLRLEMSLKCLNPKASLKIVMVHYPPIGTRIKALPCFNTAEQVWCECLCFWTYS